MRSAHRIVVSALTALYILRNLALGLISSHPLRVSRNRPPRIQSTHKRESLQAIVSQTRKMPELLAATPSTKGGKQAAIQFHPRAVLPPRVSDKLEIVPVVRCRQKPDNLLKKWGRFPTCLLSSGIWHVGNVPHMFFNRLLGSIVWESGKRQD